jgi:lipopolysaccharide biosynthesis glycosyltransferase
MSLLSASRIDGGSKGFQMSSNSSSNPVVAFVADNFFARPLAAAVSSVAANLGKDREAKVFILDAGLSPENKKKIMHLQDPGRVDIQWLRLSSRHGEIAQSLPCAYTGRSTYYKMFIPELLADHPRIIYLDSDVIVEADISDLWMTDFESNYVLAVQDLINPFVSSPLGLRNWRELGRNADSKYFNAGVLVFNADRWHKENVAERLVQYLRDNYQYVQLCEQDAMNAVFGEKWGRLNARWNVLPFMNLARGHALLDRKSHDQLLARAWLLHFCGPNKPWSRRCHHPQKDRFFYYLDKTAWSGWRPKWWTINRQAVSTRIRRLLSKSQGNH